MKKKETHITSFELDPDNPPPLTKKQVAALEFLRNMPDSEIDYSDIPESLYCPASKMTAVRQEADIFADRLKGF